MRIGELLHNIKEYFGKTFFNSKKILEFLNMLCYNSKLADCEGRQYTEEIKMSVKNCEKLEKSMVVLTVEVNAADFEAAVQKVAAAGTLVFGICGGYQMLGRSVSDPEQVEAAGVTEIAGLGLLPVDTVFRGEKVQTQTRGCFENIPGMLSVLNGTAYEGYEIHMGRSGDAMPVLIGNGTVYGSYVHGIFDAPDVADKILQAVCDQKGIDFNALGTFDMREYKEQQYDKLADAVRNGLDMELVYKALNREV